LKLHPVDKQALGAFLSFYFETVPNTFWVLALRIMTGIFEVLQVAPSLFEKTWYWHHTGAPVSWRASLCLKPIV
jgi:hypothetical protein